MKKSKEKGDGKDISYKKGLIYCVSAIIVTLIGFLMDRIVIRFMNRLTFPAMNYILISITTLGESYIFAFIAVILTIALIIYKKPVSSFLMSVGLAFIAQSILKIVTARPRPFEVGLTSAGIAANYSSFPSGHTIMFFAIIPVIGKKFPRLNLILWILGILVAFSRVYLGVHYLSDVIAGAFLGYGIAWIFMKLEERYRWNL